MLEGEYDPMRATFNILKDAMDDYVKYTQNEKDKDLLAKTRAAVASQTYFYGMSEAAFEMVKGIPGKVNSTNTETIRTPNGFTMIIVPIILTMASCPPCNRTRH